MKKAIVVITALFLAATLLCAPPLADGIVSFYLSQEYGAFVRVRGVNMPRWGEISFAGLTAAKNRKTAAWFTAGKGLLSFNDPYRSADDLRISLDNLSAGEAFQDNMKIFSSWLKGAKLSALRLDHVDLLIYRVEEKRLVRILNASGPDYRIAGAARIDGNQADKLNARLAVSPDVLSRWPGDLKDKMMPDQDGWRALGLAFGGDTWTLRGVHGPLLQFSADLVSKSH